MKRKIWVVALSMAALLVAGGLFASNMGFKLNYGLDQTGTNGSASGNQTMALPYNQQASLLTADDLKGDIEAAVAASVIQITRFITTNDGAVSYDGVDILKNFSLVSGEGYTVQVGLDVPYIIVGSHDPTKTITLDSVGSNGSASGNQHFGYPYHSTAKTADDLRVEIEAAGGAGSVLQITRFIRTNDGAVSYDGVDILKNFSLVPGEGYTIQVATVVSFVPSHF